MQRIRILLTPLGIAILLLPVLCSTTPTEYIEVKIDRNKNLKEIAKKLKEHRVIQDEHGFRLMTALERKSTFLSYGWYRFKIHDYPRYVLNSLSRGLRITVCITIPEGLTAKQTLNLIGKKTDIDIEKMDALIHNQSFLRSLGIKSNNIEGYLFPDTYILYRSDDPDVVIKRMVSRLYSVLEPGLKTRIKSIKFNAYQILTIASLIEREAMMESEKPIIASVIYNRLKKGMRLQIDATVLYALGYHKSRVYYRDLKVDSPYNTYKHYGLPPGPIANPGYQSILAAIHPARTDYYYYVATGKGDHIFTRTFEAHRKARQKIKRNR